MKIVTINESINGSSFSSEQSRLFVRSKTSYDALENSVAWLFDWNYYGYYTWYDLNETSLENC